ncbi:TBP-associated factor 3 [Haematobia irritans]|uniref:TBP-associated factor 3 n=1 Tax=Haematobia irritans TaxID=7368 RepID=UPI003F50C3D3
MTDQYMKDILRVAVAQICQTIGYNATQSAPLELLQDVLDKFMKEFTRDLRRQVEHYNRTEANLDDVTLTLNSINVNVSELLDYVNNVEPVPFATEIPKFPAHKNSYLNFLKPGSKEVLTRPVHVHDHLPPMLPPEINQPTDPILPSTSNGLQSTDIKPTPEHLGVSGGNPNINESTSVNSSSNALNKSTLQSLFKPSTSFDDNDRPTREVSSVVMTTGGYISPAVEGKMPEAIVPDIIDKLMGFDAPPPPTPPPPPPPPVVPQPTPNISRPASRSSNNTPIPQSDFVKHDELDKDINTATSSTKESKKSLLGKVSDFNAANRKSDTIFTETSNKKDKLINPTTPVTTLNTNIKPSKLNKKKQAAMMQNNLLAGMHHNSPNNYASMLLKKAKKQKQPLAPGQPLLEKHAQEKPPKLDPAEKTQRKYIKMLQKMAKQGKIPAELLSAIMGSDKKSKILNPQLLQVLPPGPEKIQLEKLLKKYSKQRQKQIKQQMMMEAQKLKKSHPMPTAPPPLVPLFTPLPPQPKDVFSRPPLAVDLVEEKNKIMETKDSPCIASPTKTGFVSNIPSSPCQQVSLLADTSLSSNLKTRVLPDTLALGESSSLSTGLTISGDGKDLKLSNEPDRSKLNIFKKISKQKTPKPSSPTPLPLRLPSGLPDTPIINLPSGTTITPAPGPGPALGTSPSASRPFLPPPAGNEQNNIINLDDIKDIPTSSNVSSQAPTDLRAMNRVFGEKPPGGEADLVKGPKKRGRKPGSKNSPKLPGALPASLLKKNKKMKLDPKLFTPQMPFSPDLISAVGAGNLTFDNVAQLFGNPLNPMEWAQNKQLQQQMLIMAAAKERKDQKKKNKIMKQDVPASEKGPTMAMPTSMGAVPSNEEVQNINKKLMRMDTILKPAPSSTGGNELSVETSLITGKKLPSPSQYPQTSTSPLKSPVNQSVSKRLMQGMEAMAAAAAAGLGQPFMLPNRPAFPNLPSSMLSMLPFPFTARPGLIPTPGLFPTPGLGAFPNNPKTPLLPAMFPFPNLKQPSVDVSSQETSEDLSMGSKNKMTEPLERNYCNVAPLVPEFIKLNTPETIKNPSQVHGGDHDLTKTPKSRHSQNSAIPQENLAKKIVEPHIPEMNISCSSKSVPTNTGRLPTNTFEPLVKKNDVPLDMATSNKPTKRPTPSQDAGLDFSMNKKYQAPPNLVLKQPPITLNNEPIEVSDDSDEMSQPPPPPKNLIPVPESNVLHPPPSTSQTNFNLDEKFVGNLSTNKLSPVNLETDLSSKELKKLKKQVKKTSININNSLITPEKSEGVSKLAGGADLIPLTSTGLAYSSKNIPFNSLTANANPTFSAQKSMTDFNPAQTSVFDNVTITTTIPSTNVSSSTNLFDIQRKRKEHKKIKKEFKEGKIKKKKDKKDKSKSKERVEKYMQSQHTSPSKDKLEPFGVENTARINTSPSASIGSSGVEKIKDKDLMKKLKKEKKKEKMRMEETSIVAPQAPSIPMSEGKPKSLPPVASVSVTSNNEPEASLTTTSSSASSTSIVPKLTLKLGSTQSPTPTDDAPKNNSGGIAPTTAVAAAPPSPPREVQREPSPELARISPLVTRPPKQKVNTGSELTSGTSSAVNSLSTASTGQLDNFGDASKPSSTGNINMIVPPPNPWLSGGTISASSVLLPHQLLQTTKHDLATSSGVSNQSSDNSKMPPSGERQQSPLTLITETSRPSSYIDAEGNRVWICPACGKVDDGSPMIGCDGCDAWYHWVCVGIFVAPKDNEDWFCRVCITRKKSSHSSDKKRKRNKKK